MIITDYPWLLVRGAPYAGKNVLHNERKIVLFQLKTPQQSSLFHPSGGYSCKNKSLPCPRNSLRFDEKSIVQELFHLEGKPFSGLGH
jgi:hypothetical protein